VMTSVAQTSDEPVPSRSGRHRSSRRARPVTGAAASGRPPLPGLALVAYVVLAFLFSWSWWVPMAVRGQVAHPGQGWPTHLPGLMGPAFAAVVVTLGWQGTGALRDLGRRAVRWRGVGRWWWSVPGILALGVVGVAVSGATGTPFDLGGLAEYSGAPVFSVLVLLGYVLLVNGYGEELGWRGLLADGLVDRVGEVRTALLVTVVWATWHLPLVLGRRELPVDGLGHDRLGAGAVRGVGRADPALRRLGPQRAAGRCVAHRVQPHQCHGGDPGPVGGGHLDRGDGRRRGGAGPRAGA
jgi:membrane protease YdiL (CAAX protease family)